MRGTFFICVITIKIVVASGKILHQYSSENHLKYIRQKLVNFGTKPK